MPQRQSSPFPGLHVPSRGSVRFSRSELGLILNVYSMRVAGGDWRDYAIDHMPGMAVFSIFRHTLERPRFSIVKLRQASDRRSFEYAVFQGSQLLRRASGLKQALRILDRKLTVVK